MAIQAHDPTQVSAQDSIDQTSRAEAESSHKDQVLPNPTNIQKRRRRRAHFHLHLITIPLERLWTGAVYCDTELHIAHVVSSSSTERSSETGAYHASAPSLIQLAHKENHPSGLLTHGARRRSECACSAADTSEKNFAGYHAESLRSLLF